MTSLEYEDFVWMLRASVYFINCCWYDLQGFCENNIYEPIIMLISLTWWRHQNKKIFICLDGDCLCLFDKLLLTWISRLPRNQPCHLWAYNNVDACWVFMSSEWGRRVTRGGRGGEVSPVLFQKLEKSALIWGKNALVVVIYGLNFLFKMQFVRFSRRKSRRFFPPGPFLCTRSFIKVPYFQENSAALKNSWLRACRDISLCLNVDCLNTWKFILQQKSLIEGTEHSLSPEYLSFNSSLTSLALFQQNLSNKNQT